MPVLAKHPEKCKKTITYLRTKRTLNIKMSAKGGPVFTFSFPGRGPRPLCPAVTSLLKSSIGINDRH